MNYPSLDYYRHYKGQLYLVIGIADDSNTDTLREVVVYVGLQFDGAKPGHRMKIRTVEHFMGWVEDPSFALVTFTDGTTHRARLRYTYLGPVLTEEMING